MAIQSLRRMLPHVSRSLNRATFDERAYGAMFARVKGFDCVGLRLIPTLPLADVPERSDPKQTSRMWTASGGSPRD
jgi:hypothetical protein